MCAQVSCFSSLSPSLSSSENEKVAFDLFRTDPIGTFAPLCPGAEEKEGNEYLKLQNLLYGFFRPSVMDCKIGIRSASLPLRNKNNPIYFFLPSIFPFSLFFSRLDLLNFIPIAGHTFTRMWPPTADARTCSRS